MSGSSLITLGDLTKPATVLIEKISDAVGAIFAPYQMVRLAKAQVEVERIRDEARTDIEARAIDRLLKEEAAKQENIEHIVRLALPDVQETARPESIDEDWVVNFFDKCRLTSNDDMQLLWSRILSGEANAPGAFAKRTVNLVATLTRSEAEQFTALCAACWAMGDDAEDLIPVILTEDEPIYKTHGITFDSVAHLNSIGLIRYASEGFTQFESLRQPTYSYFGRSVRLTLPFPDVGRQYPVPIGRVMFTRTGLELARIAGAMPSDAIFQYILTELTRQGYSPTVLTAPPNAG